MEENNFFIGTHKQIKEDAYSYELITKSGHEHLGHPALVKMALVFGALQLFYCRIHHPLSREHKTPGELAFTICSRFFDSLLKWRYAHSSTFCLLTQMSEFSCFPVGLSFSLHLHHSDNYHPSGLKSLNSGFRALKGTFVFFISRK